jgi:peptide/nickel transport system permease protein
LRRLFKRRTAALGLFVVLAMVLLALLAPWIAPFDPLATSFTLVRKAPSGAHWFGTDEAAHRLRQASFPFRSPSASAFR